MDEITPPAIIGGPKELVPYVDHRRDAGTGWVRALSESQKTDLSDLAGELARIFPLNKNRRVTPKQFQKKLEQLEAAEDAHSKLLRIVGYTSGLVTLYYIWWAWAYSYNFSRELVKCDDEDAAREATAIRMGLQLNDLLERLSRRDVSMMVNVFLTRRAREMEGEVAMRTSLDALQRGDARSKDVFFKYVGSGMRSKESEQETPQVFDPTNMSEHVLMAEIQKMRKEVGMVTDSIDAEVEISENNE